MAPQLDRPDPPYLQIAGHIRAQIESGVLRDGERVSSARQIAADWQVSLATATKVLATLRSEGLVRGVVGIGTIVSTTEAGHAPKDRFVSIRRTGRIYPPNEHAEIKSAEIVTASEKIADALRVEVGAPVIRRHRVTYRGETAVSASVSYFSGDLAEAAPRLLEVERIRQGTTGYIEETTGRTVTSGHDQHAAAEATEQDAEDLGVAVGSPVLRGRNWVYDLDGDVIEYGESVATADRWTSYDFEIAND